MAGDDKTVFDPGATRPENDRTVYEGDKTVLDSAKTQYGSGDTVPETGGTTLAAAALSDAAAQGEAPAPAENATIVKGETLLDTYAVESDAIEGGMGSVWRVHHKGWNVDLAMKRPQPKCFSTEKSKADFIHECEAWINLGLHPNIVSCYYVREISGTPTIFSEWMDGGSLESAITKGTLYEGTDAEQQKRILDIAIQFARGLHYAHEAKPHGLIHQDVKPDNLLLTKSGEAKVADFGLAKARAVLTQLNGAPTMNDAPDSGKTIASPSGGYTPAYCSMEQMDGKELTIRTDIYSWAVSVMEMYCGERHWPNGVMAGLGCETYFEQTKLPLLDAMRALLKTCLDAEPENRPHDFAEVEVKLHEIYKAETGSDYPRPAPKAAADTADSLNNRALSYLDLGKNEDAEKLWKQAAALNPNHLESIYNAALLSWRNGSISDADMAKRLNNVADVHDEALLKSMLQQIDRERGEGAPPLSGPKPDRILAAALENIRQIYPMPGGRAVIIISKNWSYGAWLWDMERDCPLTTEMIPVSAPMACILMEGRYVVMMQFELPVVFDGETFKQLDIPALKTAGKCHTFCADWEKTGFYFIGGKGAPRKLWHFDAAHMTLNASAESMDFKYDEPVLFCALPDGERVVTQFGYPRSVHTLQRAGELETGDMYGLTYSVASENGAFLLSCSKGGSLPIVNSAQTGKRIHTLPFPAQAVALSPDSRYALLGAQGQLLLLETASWRCVCTFPFIDRVPNFLAFSFDGTDCYASQYNQDRGIRTWKVPTAFVPASWSLCRITAVGEQLGADARFLALCSEFETVLSRGEGQQARAALAQIREIPGYADARECADMNARLNRTRIPKRLRAMHLIASLEGASILVMSTVNRYCAMLSQNGAYALSPGNGELWSVESGRQIFRAPCFYILGGFTADGGRCVIAEPTAQALLLDSRTGKCLAHYVFGSYGERNLRERYGEIVRVQTENAENILHIAISPDGRYIATGTAKVGRNGIEGETTVTVWRTDRMGRAAAVAGLHRLEELVFSPDSKQLLIYSLNSLLLCETETGKALRDFGHRQVSPNCFSADGRYILTHNGDMLETESRTALPYKEIAIGYTRSCFVGATGIVATANPMNQKRLILRNIHTNEVLFERKEPEKIIGISASADGTRLMLVRDSKPSRAEVFLLDWVYGDENA